MCTVSFVPGKTGILLTSNRDEKCSRKPALPPCEYVLNDFTLLYPKDADRGGTWMAASNKGSVAVLLNGALIPHLPNAKYITSRGFVIPSVLASADPPIAFSSLDLSTTEPFTLIIYHNQKLTECRWDGSSRTVKDLPAATPHIWSSATLYTSEVVQKRRQWFNQWCKDNPQPSMADIIRFHRFTGDGDTENDLVMNRSCETFTVSITAITIEENAASMEYLDLQVQKRYRYMLSFSAGRSPIDKDCWRRFFIRLRNWEYWPFHVVYIPIFVYWFWLCIKARSFFFFNTANPTIRNGGFLMESKKEIYDLLPRGTYPATLLVQAGSMSSDEAIALTQQHHLSFPLIAKPDIGLRGIGVSKLNSADDLVAYHNNSTVDYLVQAFVPYTKEVGVFYYRLPGHKQGVITGLVGKELLTVKGNGTSTLEQLLQAENRFVLQLPALRKAYGGTIGEIIPDGEERLVVPYGNHSRGAKFLDITHQLGPQLFTTINDLCVAVPGFYFGRLDIKYDNWEDLCAGRNFSIIELNGSGSEPAHIYDPKHSLFFAWREIIRHLRILYLVIKQNKKLRRMPYLSTKEGLTLLRQNSAYVKKIS